jgi:hypothetical protein
MSYISRAPSALIYILNEVDAYRQFNAKWLFAWPIAIDTEVMGKNQIDLSRGATAGMCERPET